MKGYEILLAIGVFYGFIASLSALLQRGPQETLQPRIANLWRGAIACGVLAIALKLAAGI